MLKNRRKRIFNCHYFVNVRQESIHGNHCISRAGQMGSPMANNLLQKGHSLQVFDVNAQAVDALVTQGATAAQTPAEAAAGAEFIITMLPNGDIVRQVLLGEKGVCEAVSSDALLIDMSTIHPLQTDALIRELQEKGISMMDAPWAERP